MKVKEKLNATSKGLCSHCASSSLESSSFYSTLSGYKFLVRSRSGQLWPPAFHSDNKLPMYPGLNQSKRRRRPMSNISTCIPSELRCPMENSFTLIKHEKISSILLGKKLRIPNSKFLLEQFLGKLGIVLEIECFNNWIYQIFINILT